MQRPLSLDAQIFKVLEEIKKTTKPLDKKAIEPVKENKNNDIDFDTQEKIIWNTLLASIKARINLKSKVHFFNCTPLVQAQAIKVLIDVAFNESCALYKKNPERYVTGRSAGTSSGGGGFVNFMQGRTRDQYIKDGLPGNDTQHGKLSYFKNQVEEIIEHAKGNTNENELSLDNLARRDAIANPKSPSA